MKKSLVFLFICITTISYSQNFSSKDWVDYPHNSVPEFTITKSEEFKYQNLTFKAKWDEKLSYSENLGRHYGGIGELKIFYKNRSLQTINKIEDGVALGEINFYFYDFNMDGYLDFSIRSVCAKSCYYDYYLYNPGKNQFVYNVQWDGIRIAMLNKKNKQLLTMSDGTASEGEKNLYQIKNDKLIHIKTISYKQE